MQVLKKVARLQTVYAALIEEVLPKVFPDNPDLQPGNFQVSLGKLGDINDKIKVPGFYVTRTDLIMEQIDMDNLKNFTVRQNPQTKYHHVMYSTAIVIEIITSSYASNEILSDAVANLVLATKPYIIREFKLHSITNPTVSAPEIVDNTGGKIWKNFVQFGVQLEHSWAHAVSAGKKLESIVVKILREPDNELILKYKIL